MTVGNDADSRLCAIGSCVQLEVSLQFDGLVGLSLREGLGQVGVVTLYLVASLANHGVGFNATFRNHGRVASQSDFAIDVSTVFVHPDSVLAVGRNVSDVEVRGFDFCSVLRGDENSSLLCCSEGDFFCFQCSCLGRSSIDILILDGDTTTVWHVHGNFVHRHALSFGLNPDAIDIVIVFDSNIV